MGLVLSTFSGCCCRSGDGILNIVFGLGWNGGDLALGEGGSTAVFGTGAGDGAGAGAGAGAAGAGVGFGAGFACAFTFAFGAGARFAFSVFFGRPFALGFAFG